jgi:hypothetical protein
MQLPGRLRSTSLGDLLGTLHRGEATGILELTEDTGRVHRVYLARGLVVAAEVDGASPTLAEVLRRDRAADDELLRRSLLRALSSQRLHGDVLTTEFNVSPHIVGDALRRQVIERLSVLDRLIDARIGFRVAARAPRHSLAQAQWEGTSRGAAGGPLKPLDFLHGRRRARERPDKSEKPETREACQTYETSQRHRAAYSESAHRAWRLLGLSPGAGETEIKQAYRRLARAFHPDGHPHASDDERRALQTRFAQVTDAYRALR